jgi:signal transduction histidine kinase
MTARDERERLSLIVHEVRSPTAALSAIAVALSDDGIDEQTTRNLLELAIAACRGIERIVEGTAVGSLRIEDVDVASIARDAATAAALGGARVRLEVHGNVPTIRGDPVRLRQALDNLVANAVSHSLTGDEILVSAGGHRSTLVVSVSDRGVGIPLVEQDRIFQAGVRLGTGQSGEGLGLAVARSVAEAHGGTLTVESIPDEGATFVLALPRPGT